MFKNVREYLVRLLLAPVIAHFRTQAAIEAAECKAEILRRAAQADADQQPELARELRDYASQLTIDTQQVEQIPGILPAPSVNGHTEAPALPAPKKPGRPRKESSNEAQA